MNNEITSALEVLAQKLGTTSEYLWGVLLKQAPISAFVDLAQYTFIALVCVFWIRKVPTFVDKISNGDWNDENWIWISAISTILSILVAIAFFSFPNTFYALVNPEYWALNKLLPESN